jgi:hypothetical protein
MVDSGLEELQVVGILGVWELMGAYRRPREKE